MLGIALFAQYGARERRHGHERHHATRPWAELREIETNYAYLNTKINGICSTEPWSYCPTGRPHAEPVIGSCTNPGIAMGQASNQLKTRTDLTFFRGDGRHLGRRAELRCARRRKRPTRRGPPTSTSGRSCSTTASFDATYMKNLVRGIGFSQVSPNAADLPMMYEEVAKSLPTTLVD